jgi:outer membrane protein assembly factor BamB
MRVPKKSTSWILRISIVVVIYFACCEMVAAKAFTYKKPIKDPDIDVNIYIPDKTWNGTTLLADNHKPERPRIIEVNMQGQIVWEYVLPFYLKGYTNPGFDVERVPNNNILFVLPRKGVYEIDRSGKTVWKYLDGKVTHDADRLPNGNTLIVCGGRDDKFQAQVKEVNPKGKIVWAWHAKDQFYKSPYKDIYLDGWTHANAVTRLANGNTLISLRNFNFAVEVSPRGEVVKTLGKGILYYPHDPEVTPNGNILAATQRPLLSFSPLRIDFSVNPPHVVEFDPNTGKIIWTFERSKWKRQLPRDADRLPNGNTLITGTTEIIEVAPNGQIVWRLRGKTKMEKGDAPRKGFYKAERIAAH